MLHSSPLELIYPIWGPLNQTVRRALRQVLVRQPPPVTQGLKRFEKDLIALQVLQSHRNLANQMLKILPDLCPKYLTIIVVTTATLIFKNASPTKESGYCLACVTKSGPHRNLV